MTTDVTLRFMWDAATHGLARETDGVAYELLSRYGVRASFYVGGSPLRWFVDISSNSCRLVCRQDSRGRRLRMDADGLPPFRWSTPMGTMLSTVQLVALVGYTLRYEIVLAVHRHLIAAGFAVENPENACRERGYAIVATRAGTTVTVNPLPPPNNSAGVYATWLPHNCPPFVWRLRLELHAGGRLLFSNLFSPCSVGGSADFLAALRDEVASLASMYAVFNSQASRSRGALSDELARSV